MPLRTALADAAGSTVQENRRRCGTTGRALIASAAESCRKPGSLATSTALTMSNRDAELARGLRHCLRGKPLGSDANSFLFCRNGRDHLMLGELTRCHE